MFGPTKKVLEGYKPLVTKMVVDIFTQGDNNKEETFPYS